MTSKKVVNKRTKKKLAPTKKKKEPVAKKANPQPKPVQAKPPVQDKPEPAQSKSEQAKPAQRATPKTRKLRKFSWRPLIIAACILVGVIAILYPVGREYYQTLRTEQRLQAQIDAVNQRNEAVQAENEALQTEEGIENQARSAYGWVKDGENSAVVTNEQGTVDNASRLPEHLDKDSITAPKTWYYNILDFILFVHE